jgi:hypothetical protein
MHTPIKNNINTQPVNPLKMWQSSNTWKWQQKIKILHLYFAAKFYYNDQLRKGEISMHIVCMRKKRNVYLIRKSEGMIPHGRCTWTSNFKMILKKCVRFEVFTFSQRWLWRMPSSGMWCRVELVWTDVSEECIASIFRVEKPQARNLREQVAAVCNMFLQNVGSHKLCMVPHPRRWHSS